MSYSPATKLSYNDGSEEAIVLTDGIVMITMVGGVPWRERMKLADWLILAEDKAVVSYIPNAPVATAPATAPATPVATQAPETTDAPVTPVSIKYENYPYSYIVDRTKFKWVLDKENYCVAVQTSKGVLQVKSIRQCPCRDVSCGESYDKTLYKTFEDWIKSLPNEGASGRVTITAP